MDFPPWDPFNNTTACEHLAAGIHNVQKRYEHWSLISLAKLQNTLSLAPYDESVVDSTEIGNVLARLGQEHHILMIDVVTWECALKVYVEKTEDALPNRFHQGMAGKLGELHRCIAVGRIALWQAQMDWEAIYQERGGLYLSTVLQ